MRAKDRQSGLAIVNKNLSNEIGNYSLPSQMYVPSIVFSAQDFPFWYLGVGFLLLRFVSSAQLRDKPVLNPDTLVTLATKKQKNVATRDSRLRFWLHRARDRECDNNDDRVTSICCFQLVVVSFCFCFCFLFCFWFVCLCLPLLLALPWPGDLRLATEIEFILRRTLEFINYDRVQHFSKSWREAKEYRRSERPLGRPSDRQLC